MYGRERVSSASTQAGDSTNRQPLVLTLGSTRTTLNVLICQPKDATHHHPRGRTLRRNRFPATNIASACDSDRGSRSAEDVRAAHPAVTNELLAGACLIDQRTRRHRTTSPEDRALERRLSCRRRQGGHDVRHVCPRSPSGAALISARPSFTSPMICRDVSRHSSRVTS